MARTIVAWRFFVLTARLKHLPDRPSSPAADARRAAAQATQLRGMASVTARI